MSNKIGFNNFKAFGPKMQYFSKKPITLIYGPNSIGKSSLLHSQLVSAYFYNQNSYQNFYKTSFAGDKLDLGGFKNFIHKHKTTDTITYETLIRDKKSILKVFNIKELLDIKICNEYLNIELIKDKLESNYLNSQIKLKYLLEQDIIEYIFMLKKQNDYYTSENELNTAEENLKSQIADIQNKAASEYYNKTIIDITDEEFETFLDCYPKERINWFEVDDLEKLIFLTLQINPSDIKERILFFNELKNINEIKIINVLSEDGFINFSLDIDNKRLLSEKKNGNSFELIINKENSYLKKFNNISKKLKIFQRVNKSKLSKYSDYHFDFALLLSLNKYSPNNQYFGPLRDYPERSDLYIIEELKNRKDSILKRLSILFVRNRITFFIGILLLGIPNFYYNNYISTKSFFETDYISLFLAFPILVLLFLGIYGTLSKSDEGKEHLNKILPKKFHLLKDKVITSYDTWKILSKSNNLLNKLNSWLQDSNKLKSNYQVKIIKSPITYLGILGISLANIFNIDRLKFEHDNFTNSIANIWNFVERKLNITQRFESKLVFMDISKNTEVTPRDMGLGISQMLPILISTMNSKDTKIFLEQPELHLHPAVQMELMDEFIKSHNEKQNEFMMESHSEHMLLRVMKRIRQTNDGTLEDESLRLTPDDVCLLYVDNDGEQTYIQELRLSKTGKLLDHWPNGFFEEGYKERFF